jgi:hypothetical protein
MSVEVKVGQIRKWDKHFYVIIKEKSKGEFLTLWLADLAIVSFRTTSLEKDLVVCDVE